MKNWELYTHALTSEDVLDLRRLPTGQGIWAPCLRYNEKEDFMWKLFGIKTISDEIEDYWNE